MFLKSLNIIAFMGLALGLGAGRCELSPEQEEALCEAGRGRFCDRLNVVDADLCAGTAVVVERCEKVCQLGRCVDGPEQEDGGFSEDGGEPSADPE